MRTDTMRWIDRVVGTPACHALAPLAPLFVRPGRAGRVVLCKFFGLGSISLSYPLISALGARGHDLVYLTFDGNDPLVNILGVETCIVIDRSSPWRFARGTLGAIFRLRRLRPEAFLNLEFFSRFAAILSLLSGAPKRAGFHIVHLPVGKLYSERVNLNVYRQIAENYMNVARALGLIEGTAVPDGSLAFDVAGGEEAPHIIVNAESSETLRDLKSWPLDHWIGLLGRLRAAYPEHRIIIVGTEAGRDHADAFRRAFPDDGQLVDMTGATSIAELLRLIAAAELVVTVDSAPLHFGALLGRPTVCLFGPETPVLYGYDRASVRCLYKGLICSPCLALYDAKASVLDCTDNRCMKEISVDRVMEAVEDLLPAG